MPDREKYIEILNNTVKTVKEFNEDTPIKISLECVEDILELLKEQKEKPLRCDKCSYHREDGWCGMHKRCVTETDYCSLGAWKG